MASRPHEAPGGAVNAHGGSVLVRAFGIGVRQLREAQGWSQEQLAENSNLNRSYVGEIERGRVIASLLTVEKLALALKLTPSALLTRGEAVGQQRGHDCVHERAPGGAAAAD